MLRTARVILLVATCLLLQACRAERPRTTIDLKPCRLKGLSARALCGTYEVFEDRDARQGRRLALDVAVIPARKRKAAPDPLFILVGGPGQAATRAGPAIAAALTEVRRDRDIVLVDQRGTGGAHALDCTPPGRDPEAIAFGDMFPAAELAACRARLAADLRLYTTPIAVDDLDEVRAALGYERINLWGASYGTRAALVYLRQHPDRVRSVVLDGVAPVDMRLPLTFGRDGQRALDLLLDACEADESCRSTFPALRTKVAGLFERLAREPARATVVHPRSGRPVEVIIGRDDFAAGLQKLLYAPTLSALVPVTVARAADGDFTPFVAQLTAMGGDGSSGVATGMLFSVTCAEDVAAIADEDATRAAANTFLGEAITRAFRGACADWPRGVLPANYAEPVTSDAPVLILSGALDPVTPPAWGERAARTLRNARHVVVPGAGHGATLVGCVPKLVADFLAAPSPGLDATCAEKAKRPPFILDFAGPMP